jgi:hypothetical protein
VSEVEELDIADDVVDSDPVAADTLSLQLRYSVLKIMDESAEKARHAMLREFDGQSLALRLGSGTHALTFGTPEVIEFTGKQRRGKDWDAFKVEHDGKVILNRSEMRRAQGIADSLRRNAVAQRILFAPGAVREQRIDWSWDGRAWRSTPDARAFRWLAELKTTRNANPEFFLRDAKRMHYHSQLAIYRHAIEQSEGWRPRDVYLFAVETVPPYAVVPYQLTERSLEHGWRKACEWHQRWLECEAKDEWPGYTTGIEELDVYDAEDEAEIEAERMMRDDDGTRANVAF